ncbi:MAG: hypothetical protein KDB69_08820, partial [Acidimicrobiia bacterium]|nr:hypothetical protein [Acidimicrobiia bacterium]
RADSELMPGIEWASTTLATFPLEPGTCAYYPGGSLQAMSSTDSLITLLFTNEQFGGAWPADGFDDTVFRPESGSEAATICDGLDDLEIHWDVWQNNGRGLRILVAFGAEVTDAQRDETWAIVSSLKRVPGSGGTCVVTAPMEPDWVPPGLWPNYPSDELQAWFGSPDLWTALPKSPWYYVPRLSAWWSQHYTDPGRDPQPDIFVTYDRIGTAETVTSSDLGTNASTPQDGVFMIADIAVEFPSSGCWRVWAEYEGFTVSYVIQVP